ncbi:MAG: hypothetical protein COA50_03785 [Flavobacteriaceae bacterium]|nr:MAG: hypothetical protein COA50_03785 [Flavobacteriaceae bacterium]
MFKTPFSFYGRIRRLEYGLTYLFYILFYLAIAVIWTEFEQVEVMIIPLYIVLFWLRLAQGAKRCHDLGNSGFYQLIPLYGLWLMFQDGEQNENKYGLNPKILATNYDPSREKISIVKTLIEVSSAVLLNMLLIAIAMEYLYTDEWMILNWMFWSIVVCYFLMLLINYRGKALPDTRKTEAHLPIIYTLTLCICFILYVVSYRGVEFSFETILLGLVLAAIFLAFTYVPYFAYKLLFKKTENYES